MKPPKSTSSTIQTQVSRTEHEATAVCCFVALATYLLLLLQKTYGFSHLLGKSCYCCVDALTLIIHAVAPLLLMAMIYITIQAVTFILLHSMTALYIHSRWKTFFADKKCPQSYRLAFCSSDA